MRVCDIDEDLGKLHRITIGNKPLGDGHRITQILCVDFDDQRFEMRLMVEDAPSAMRRGKPTLQCVSRKQAVGSPVCTRGDPEVRVNLPLMRSTRKQQD